jgi:BirA family transcriptional regulator, biotin operon repressor / biotin---[acetyl-CoA-carboxylase] ligase
MRQTFDLTQFHNRRLGSFGQTLYWYDQLESTNVTAEKLAREGCPHGTVVVANQQTLGRGRKGTRWFSPPDVNLYLSVIVRPKLNHMHYLPFLTALAVLKALDENAIRGDLKWPNDILVDGQKIAGILIQSASEENSLQYAIIGCGMNVNLMEFPSELQGSVTSVALKSGKFISRESLLATFLFQFEKLYSEMNRMKWEDLCAELERHSTILRGCDVQIRQDHEVYQGITEGLDTYGGLIVNLGSESKIFYAGQVESCRKK